MTHRLLAALGIWVLGLTAGCGGTDGNAPASSSPNTPPPAATNALPTARAGGAQSVLIGATVQLDGTASTDPEGGALTYAWSLIARPLGSTATLSASTSPRPTFLADTAGSYVANLVVSDGVNASIANTVTVTAALGNVAPVARAGSDRGALPGSTVSLSGAASSDANGDALSFSWTLSKPPGSVAVLSSATTEASSFVPDLVGSYVATLVVRDGALDSTPSTVTITVSNANLPPVARPGGDQTVAFGSRVRLDGSASSDPNGDPLSFQWSLSSRPAGSTASLQNRNAPRIELAADVIGLYVLSLVVSDGLGASAGATVTITATEPVPALAAGSGMFVQSAAELPFVGINAITGSTRLQAASCGSHSAADLMPDGVVLATSSARSTLTQVDVATGRCTNLFPVAEPMAAIAVSASGVVHLLSEASVAGVRQLYRYGADGVWVSRQAVSGTATVAGVPNLTTPEGMDFAPDGTLYVSQQGALWRLDPGTGVGTLRATGVLTSGDFDIDAAGLLRSIQDGQLHLIRSSDWTVDRSVVIQGRAITAGAVVHR
jgi:chitinase